MVRKLDLSTEGHWARLLLFLVSRVVPFPQSPKFTAEAEVSDSMQMSTQTPGALGEALAANMSSQKPWKRLIRKR